MKAKIICLAAMVTAMAAACGGGNEGTGGAGGEGGSSGVTTGNGSTGSTGSTGNTTSSTTSGTPGTCPESASGSAANHIVVTVSWPATTGLEAGTGEMHIWTKTDLTFSGNDVTGTVKPCGSVIPALTKSSLAGGGQVQTQIPDSVWDKPSMPTFQAKGSISGFQVGATIAMDPVASAVGLTMQNPLTDPWPASGGAVMAVDADSDGHPGILTIPRTDPPFAAPPLDLLGALNPNGARADEVYVVTRTVVELSGTRDSCTTAKGAAMVTKVDSHVVGCHVKGGGNCTSAQAKFVDDNQPKFTVKSATYDMMQIPATATCADVRAALPAK